eukprot:CAMPEP_0113942748 /NCGR_PEP_ID=MMETSP1339-20121228/9051_1 /TAXON_ID=94617 /ORGANISM="Fibrocapsa japonica" /LENGTH=126 /DNA_ID=CAMNT_0000947327 /DNA_START=69 /DNA_END=449 /DNA_ORIENTATION=+ /assembly_acc=CAM_ASM_000762
MIRATKILQQATRGTYAAGLQGMSAASATKYTRENLLSLQEQILEKIQKIPEDAEYHKNVVAFTNFRMKVVKDNEDVSVIEQELQAGHLDDLVEQGYDELKLIDLYHDWKMWEHVPKNTGEGIPGL